MKKHLDSDNRIPQILSNLASTPTAIMIVLTYKRYGDLQKYLGGLGWSRRA